MGLQIDQPDTLFILLSKDQVRQLMTYLGHSFIPHPFTDEHCSLPPVSYSQGLLRTR